MPNKDIGQLNDPKFISMISHELKSPLNAILGFSSTLLMNLSGPLNHDQEYQVKIINQSAKNLLNLIDKIVDLFQVELNHISVVIQDIDCINLIKQCMTSISNQATGKGIKISVTHIKDKIYVKSDIHILEIIVSSILHNAIKYTDNGSITIEIDHLNENNKSFTLIRIIDTGIGIPTTKQDTLFTAFEVISTQEEHQCGSGLSLYISSKLAKLIGVKIDFSSEYGKGTTFNISIPN